LGCIIPIRASQISLEGTNYVKRTLKDLWEELPLLVLGSLLMDLAAVPAVLILFLTRNVPLASVIGLLTIMPAWVGYCYTIGRNAVGFKLHFGDLLSASLHYYGRSSLLGIPSVILLLAVMITLPWLSKDLPMLVVIGIALQAIALLFSCLLLIHALPLLACFDLSLRQALVNSLILVMRWPIIAVGLLSLSFLLTLAARAIGLGTWLILPLLFAPFEVNATLMLSKRVVEMQE